MVGVATNSELVIVAPGSRRSGERGEGPQVAVIGQPVVAGDASQDQVAGAGGFGDGCGADAAAVGLGGQSRSLQLRRAGHVLDLSGLGFQVALPAGLGQGGDDLGQGDGATLSGRRRPLQDGDRINARQVGAESLQSAKEIRDALIEQCPRHDIPPVVQTSSPLDGVWGCWPRGQEC